MKGERRGALLVLGVLALSAALGGIYGPSVRATASGASDLQDSLKNFTRVLSIVQQEYAIPVDTDHALYDGAIPGMLRVLDPHSTFFDPRQYALLREDQRGKYYGVGICVLVDVAGAEAVRVGEIENVDRSGGAAPLLVVRGAKGEVLVPFTKSYLRKIDLAAKRVEMELPVGLVDLSEAEEA